jgi:hypothetical protein
MRKILIFVYFEEAELGGLLRGMGWKETGQQGRVVLNRLGSFLRLAFSLTSRLHVSASCLENMIP